MTLDLTLTWVIATLADVAANDQGLEDAWNGDAPGAGSHAPASDAPTGRLRRPSMADVARLAGTSAQTVSRVLSGHPHVSEYTRQEVLAAVHQTGYRRTGIARALTTGRSMTIGVVYFESDPLYARSTITLGTQRAARDHGYVVSTAGTTSLSTAAIAEAIDRLRHQGVDGLVIAVPVHDDPSLVARTEGLPTVVVDGLGSISDAVVAVDQEAVGRLATQHLLDLGHSTVWHVGGPESWIDATGRSAGWARTLADSGRAAPPILYGDWSPDSGYRNGQVIARLPEVTAVFVASDEMAFGLIRALREMGRRVPEDVSVVSIDDISLAKYCDPPLTTIRQPFENLGRTAVEQVISFLEHPDAQRDDIFIEAELVIRGSTAPPAA